MKTRLYVLIASFFITLGTIGFAHSEQRVQRSPNSITDFVLKARAHNYLSKDEILAPEGIAMMPDGKLITGSMSHGTVFLIDPVTKSSQVIFNVKSIPGWNSLTKLLGFVADDNGQVWFAVSEFRGGCIFGLRLHEQGEAKALPVMCNLGQVNGLVVDQRRQMLYASALMSIKSGRIIQLPLKLMNRAFEKSKTLTDMKFHRYHLLDLDMPNGLVLSPNGDELLISQTSEKRVVAYHFEEKSLRTVLEIKENCWLDGLAYINDFDLFAVTDSKQGRIHLFTLKGTKISSRTIVNQHGGITGLASVTYANRKMYITDLWAGSTTDVLIRETLRTEKHMNYHSNIFEIDFDVLIP